MRLRRTTAVIAATAGLVLAGSPAFAAPGADAVAAPAERVEVVSLDDDGFSFEDAVELFVSGGAAVGYGVAALIAGAYSGIATTPELVLDSLGG
ncbi:MAG TPA: hypothetical protein VGD67_18590 [Pseudonocardiaceae bacterium]